VTIAACYVTTEGVVLGADSTASAFINPGGFHYFNFNQKLFEIGDPGTGTLGAITWGMGGLERLSYRTKFAFLAEALQKKPAKNVKEVADRWVELLWPDYNAATKVCRDLNAKRPFDPITAPADPDARTWAEEDHLNQLKRALFVGFCIGGHLLPQREPQAFTVLFDPLSGQPAPGEVGMGRWAFWGAPNMIQRLILGCDDEIKQSLLRSGKWNGSPEELEALLAQHSLATVQLPIRDAVDFIHACIGSTIKALKFSSLAQICGGPIEIAVITTDRRFRWVRHKEWDAAIMDGTP
jgi:hypothetical protein